MHLFEYRKGKLYCENLPLQTLVARHGTPLFVYSQQTLTRHYRDLDTALAPVDHHICYAMKANSNLAVIRVLANLGSGFDVVSGGELQRVIAAGGDPRGCVFAGVGKSEDEIEFALRKKIYCFNVESIPELDRIEKVARKMKTKAPVAIRVNPNVDAKTHAKITTGTYENKFGIAFEQVEDIYARIQSMSHLHARGLQMHIGSQLTDVRPFVGAVEKVAPLASRLAQAYGIEFFSIGGGIGIVYEPALKSGEDSWWNSKEGKDVITPEKYARAILGPLKDLSLKILIEPGRFIAGNAGVLVTRVEFIKQTSARHFVIVDAAMNDLIRPSFYDAYHEIVPLRETAGKLQLTDVVGPICESGDTFCRQRPLPPLREGDFLALMSAGAYGSVMGSTYNSRPLAAEVLVNGRKSAVVRKRQAVKEIWKNETVADWLKD